MAIFCWIQCIFWSLTCKSCACVASRNISRETMLKNTQLRCEDETSHLKLKLSLSLKENYKHETRTAASRYKYSVDNRYANYLIITRNLKSCTVPLLTFTVFTLMSHICSVKQLFPSVACILRPPRWGLSPAPEPAGPPPSSSSASPCACATPAPNETHTKHT